MAIFQQVLVVLAALAGVGFGYSLTYVTPSEVVAGRRIFEWMERGLLVGAFVPVLYYLVRGGFWAGVAVAGVFLALLFFVPLLVRVVLASVFFAVVLFSVTSGDVVVQLVQGTMVFLYGLPAGTLLRKNPEESEEED